jgi:glutamate N-acetyltransferase/amino-acid N-acetyltransferase
MAKVSGWRVILDPLPWLALYDIFRYNMDLKIELVQDGSVTSPKGFYAGATSAGIKKGGGVRLDLGMLFSERPCTAAAVFTRNRIKAAPVALSRRRLRDGTALALVVNSGCANAGTGRKGLKDAVRMTKLAAQGLGVLPEEVLVASTGVIGERLPMGRIGRSIDRIALSRDGGHELARAIMTTDTVPKEVAVTVEVEKKRFIIGGVAKGSGMIHPDLGTMLCFLATDAAVELDFLRLALRRAVAISFNMVSIDGDTSPNDMVLLMANGSAGSKPVTRDGELAEVFQQALDRVCLLLARRIAGDGEGAGKLIEVTVGGALNVDQARRAARTVVSSFLVKAAVRGSDPNWGRVLAALGRSGAWVVESKLDLYMGDVCVWSGGKPLPFSRRNLRRRLSASEVPIAVHLNLGMATATAWGCDLSEEYVTINSQYTT